MEVLMREKSIRSRVTTLARFSIFTPTADGLSTHSANKPRRTASRHTPRRKKQPLAASPPLCKDAPARNASQRHEGKIESGTLDNQQRKTVAIHAQYARNERGKNAHGKALCPSQERAHQIQRMFGSQEQESGSVS